MAGTSSEGHPLGLEVAQEKTSSSRLLAFWRSGNNSKLSTKGIAAYRASNERPLLDEGGFEYPFVWGLLAVAIVLRGRDRYGLNFHIGWRKWATSAHARRIDDFRSTSRAADW